MASTSLPCRAGTLTPRPRPHAAVALPPAVLSRSSGIASCSERCSSAFVAPRARTRAALLVARAAEPVSMDSNPSLAKHQSSKYQPLPHNSIYDMDLECPHGFVEGVMRKASEGLLSTTPEATLQDIIPLLNKVTGLPVLGPDGTVIGVVSRKDVIRVRKAGGVMSDKVAKHMTTPALTISARATVQEAAELMLANNIRRLPVVDAAGRPLGLVSRTDIFKPLGNYKAVMEAEVAALQGVGSWQIKYLFDGSCPICSSMKSLLERQDNGAGRIVFVDVSADNYKPSKNMGISEDEAMETIHAIRPDGSVLQGTDAIRAMYSVVGLGWLSFLMELPLFTQVVDVLYDFVSRNRISLGNSMDALLAGKKLQMSKQGVNTCGDVDEECSVDW